MVTGSHDLIAAAAAFAAGAINALAGGGTLVTFPTLTALGLASITANTTNTVALCPGYFGGVLAQRRDLAGQGRRVALLMVTGALGGTLGGVLLLQTDEQLFRRLVPWLLLVASLLLAVQGRVRTWVARRRDPDQPRRSDAWVALPVFVAAIYGGYFGAGMGVVLLATLAFAIDEPLPRLNAVKQAVSMAVNVAAALFFIARGPLDIRMVVVMAGGSLMGGALGGRLASRIRPELLRVVVVVVGLAASTWYFMKMSP